MEPPNPDQSMQVRDGVRLEQNTAGTTDTHRAQHGDQPPAFVAQAVGQSDDGLHKQLTELTLHDPLERALTAGRRNSIDLPSMKRDSLVVIVIAAAMSTLAAAPSGVEEQQSERPRIDFNESAERARTLRAGGGSFFERLSSDRFQLYNDCEPVTMRAPWLALFTNAGIKADMAAMQATSSRIRSTAETRFRNAGVFDGEARERGRFRIRMGGSPYDFDALASFEKVVIDLVTGDVAFASTWTLRGLGGRDRVDSTPEAKASSMTDRFLTDYLDVNAEACTERSAR